MPTTYDDRDNRAGRPLIGITTWKRSLPTFLGERTELYTIGVEYVERVRSAGGVPILFPDGGVHELASYLGVIDGLILSGGDDVDPNSYGVSRDGRAYNFDSSVDASEIALVRLAREKNVPTLGICRGAQIVQVAFGGTLFTDINERYPKHPKVEGSPESILSARHPVQLEENSWLAGVYGQLRLDVNSIHHQCIRVNAEGFRVVGRSPDGLIEALESTVDWWCVCVQWHPEKMPEPDQWRIFNGFIDVSTHFRARRSRH